MTPDKRQKMAGWMTFCFDEHIFVDQIIPSIFLQTVESTCPQNQVTRIKKKNQKTDIPRKKGGVSYRSCVSPSLTLILLTVSSGLVSCPPHVMMVCTRFHTSFHRAEPSQWNLSNIKSPKCLSRVIRKVYVLFPRTCSVLAELRNETMLHTTSHDYEASRRFLHRRDLSICKCSLACNNNVTAHGARL